MRAPATLVLVALCSTGIAADCGPGPFPLENSIAPDVPFGYLSEVGPWLRVVAGAQQTCGLKVSGQVVCEEFEGRSTPEAPAGVEFRELDVSTEVCGLSSAGQAFCWPDYRGSDVPAPPQVEGLEGLSISWGLACALNEDGEATCWGDLDGPRSLVVGESLVEVSVGERDTCGISTEGELRCWGLSELVVPGGRFRDVELGSRAGCAVGEESGRVTCFGSEELASTPAEPARSVVVSDDVACLLGVAGHVECWGAGLLDSEPWSGVAAEALSLESRVLCAVDAAGEARCREIAE